MEDLSTFKKTFDVCLEKHLDKKIAEFLRGNSEKAFADYLEHAKKIIMSGGKRIRPYLACMAYGKWPASQRGERMANGTSKNDEAMQLFVSLELFHAFALMHDDIIDKGRTRHGVPTLHAKINDLRFKIKDYGEAQAILIGDLLFSWSQELLPENVRKYYFAMVNDTVLGQMLDVSLTIKKDISDDLIYEKMKLKTARYTFVYPLQMGAALAGVSETVLEFYKQFGEALGVGFQIQDDLLDIGISDKEKEISTKTKFSDIKSGQHTLLTNYIKQQGTKEQKEVLKKYFGKSVEEKDYETLFVLFEKSGAIAYGKEQSSKLFSQALSLVVKSKLNKTQKEMLKDIVLFMQNRTF